MAAGKGQPRLAAILVFTLIAALFATGLWQLAQAGWIQGKAVVAQHLLQRAWEHSLEDGKPHKAWPWADTWPVAQLRVPDQGISQIVLSGDSGSSLAFGPGLSLAGVRPGEAGLSLISGHRDTHFRFIQHLKAGDRLWLQTPQQRLAYRVWRARIVDSRHFRLAAQQEDELLVLASCYPFDAIRPGGHLRYLVYARPLTGDADSFGRPKTEN